MWRHRRISTFAWSKLRKQRIVGDYNRRFEKICLTAVWYTAVAIKQTPKMELGCIRFRFLETIVRNAAEDGRNGSTSYFADEPIGNQRSILRSAPYILDEKISLGCSLLFPGKKSYLHQGWWQTMLGRVSSQQFRQTTLNLGRLIVRLQCQKEQGEW